MQYIEYSNIPYPLGFFSAESWFTCVLYQITQYKVMTLSAKQAGCPLFSFFPLHASAPTLFLVQSAALHWAMMFTPV